MEIKFEDEATNKHAFQCPLLFVSHLYLTGFSTFVLTLHQSNETVKPSSVSIIVRDVEADKRLEPSLEWPQQHSGPIVELEPSQQPFYSLQVNKLYAVQCLVENSRPRSYVAWFNRSAPIGVPTQTLTEDSPIQYLLPNSTANNHSSKHRLSSFVHSTMHANGTFR